jgi:hypothetical protein
MASSEPTSVRWRPPFNQPQLTKWLLWPRPRELPRWFQMECRQSWRALVSTLKSSRLDNGFPGGRYRRRRPRGWIPTIGWDFDHAGGFEEPWNSPLADRCIAGLGFVCRAWSPPQFGARSSPASHPTEFDFIGSLAMTSFCTVLHLGHSNRRCSKPIGPGLMRASIMRDVQCEHRGRSMLVRDGPEEK